jgi:hypothetical protein
MARGSISRLDHAADTRLRCLAGSVWITVDGAYEDVVLEPGQSWVVPGPQRVIAQAMERSTLRFESPADCGPASSAHPVRSAAQRPAAAWARQQPEWA